MVILLLGDLCLPKIGMLPHLFFTPICFLTIVIKYACSRENSKFSQDLDRAKQRELTVPLKRTSKHSTVLFPMYIGLPGQCGGYRRCILATFECFRGVRRW